MNKRIKNKISKGLFYHCNGFMLWKYHAYQAHRNSKEIMLCYDLDGNESYFQSWRDAKRYVRTNKKEYGTSDTDTNNDLLF